MKHFSKNLKANLLCNQFLKFTKNLKLKKKRLGPTEIRTRIAGFRVLSANHYTIRPHVRDILKLRDVQIFRN